MAREQGLQAQTWAISAAKQCGEAACLRTALKVLQPTCDGNAELQGVITSLGNVMARPTIATQDYPAAVLSAVAFEDLYTCKA